MITQEDIKSEYWYDPVVGVFIRIKNGRNLGRIIPLSKLNRGYLSIWVKASKQRAQRMAWLYVHGVIPPTDVDHIDRDRSNNAISNLRLCTKAQNAHNRKRTTKISASGHENITKESGRFYVRVMTHKGLVSLGGFDTIEEAIQVRDPAVKEYRGSFYPK
ncbi:HNH endonuclease [bacterium]|nr:MAG: HNH endonuclease [bacterium]